MRNAACDRLLRYMCVLSAAQRVQRRAVQRRAVQALLLRQRTSLRRDWQQLQAVLWVAIGVAVVLVSTGECSMQQRVQHSVKQRRRRRSAHTPFCMQSSRALPHLCRSAMRRCRQRGERQPRLPAAEPEVQRVHLQRLRRRPAALVVRRRHRRRRRQRRPHHEAGHAGAAAGGVGAAPRPLGARESLSLDSRSPSAGLTGRKEGLRDLF